MYVLKTIAVLVLSTIHFATLAVAQDALPQTLFTNVHIFDGINEQRIENASVLVEGNLIKEISTDTIDAPDATIIDGGGRTLMPGMHDQHVHLLVFNPLSDGLRQNITPFHLGGVATIRSEASSRSACIIEATRCSDDRICDCSQSRRSSNSDMNLSCSNGGALATAARPSSVSLTIT